MLFIGAGPDAQMESNQKSEVMEFMDLVEDYDILH